MSRRRLSSLVLLVVAMGATTAAQDAAQAPAATHGHTADSSGAPLTLGAALDEALQRNPALATARAEFTTALRRRAAEGFLPPPSVEAEIWQWPLTSINPLDTNMYMFTMRQEIPGRGKRAALAAAADRGVDVAANDIAAREREVLAEVTRAYVELAISRESIAVHQAHVDLLRQTADLTTVRYGAGHGTQQEAIKAIAEISRLHGDLITLDERARIAAGELNALLNRDPLTPIGPVSLATDATELPPLDVLQGVALVSHPDLKGATLEIARAQADVVIAGNQGKPDYMVTGGYQLVPHTAGAWTAAVGVTWPGAPWSRHGIDAKRSEAMAGVEVARTKQAEAANAIRLAVQQAYVHATAAAERARLLDTTVVPQLRQVLEASRIAYASERGDAASVVDGQRMVLDAELARLEALSQAAGARADLERALGVNLSAIAPREVTP